MSSNQSSFKYQPQNNNSHLPAGRRNSLSCSNIDNMGGRLKKEKKKEKEKEEVTFTQFTWFYVILRVKQLFFEKIKHNTHIQKLIHRSSFVRSVKFWINFGKSERWRYEEGERWREVKILSLTRVFCIGWCVLSW